MPAPRFPSTMIPGPPTTGIGARRWPANIVPGPPAGGMGGLGITYEQGDAVLVQATPPQDYAVSLETIAPNITSLVAENRDPEESWQDALLRLLPAIAATEQQRQLLKLQTERARAGQPPADLTPQGFGAQGMDGPRLLILAGLAVAGLLLWQRSR